jgi:hypothetical protein
MLLSHGTCLLRLQFFEGEGCRMVEMACEDHDRIAASTQFMTHTVGRVLGSMGLSPTPIDTRGFQSLLNLVDNTTNDSFDLYYGLFMYNAVCRFLAGSGCLHCCAVVRVLNVVHGSFLQK